MNTLYEIRIKNTNPLIIDHSNVDSLRKKFEMLEEFIKDKIEIFLIFDTTLDSPFPSGLFIIKGYSTPFRLNWNQNGGGLFLYAHEDIPCKIFGVI